MQDEIRNIDLDLDMILTKDTFEGIEDELDRKGYTKTRTHLMRRLLRQKIAKANSTERIKLGHLDAILALSETTYEFRERGRACRVCNDPKCFGDYSHYAHPGGEV